MNVKEKFLKTNNFEELKEEEYCDLVNIYGDNDKEVNEHFRKLKNKINYKEIEKTLDEEIEHGFEIPEFLRNREKN